MDWPKHKNEWHENELALFAWSVTIRGAGARGRAWAEASSTEPGPEWVSVLEIQTTFHIKEREGRTKYNCVVQPLFASNQPPFSIRRLHLKPEEASHSKWFFLISQGSLSAVVLLVTLLFYSCQVATCLVDVQLYIPISANLLAPEQLKDWQALLIC